PTHVYSTPGSYNVTLIVTDGNGCKDTILKQGYINIATLTPGFTAPPVCQDTLMSFINTSVGATSVYWDFGDGGTSTATNPTHLYAGSGLYQVKQVVYFGGCKDSITLPVHVQPKPAADFGITPDP